MTKEQVLKGAIALIKREAEKRKLEIEDRGTGHAFDDTFWKDRIVDDSDIPNIIAGKEGYMIELRSFWGAPEIDVRISGAFGQHLLIFNFSDRKKMDSDYVSTGNYRVCEVRVDGCNKPPFDYKDALDEVFEMIEYVEKKGEEADAKS